MKHTTLRYSAGNPEQAREYPAAEAAQFAEDIRTVAAHGGGSANLSTNDPDPLISPGFLVESDRQIHAAITEAERAGFTVEILAINHENYVRVLITPNAKGGSAMFTHESGRLESNPGDHAQNLIAANAVEQCAAEDIQAAIRVLEVMADEKVPNELAQAMTTDGVGNPITDTGPQRFAQELWSSANNQTGRLREVLDALRNAASNGDQ